MISLLNLPNPSNTLLNMVNHSINSLQINNNSKQYFDSTQNNTVNSSAGQTFMCDAMTQFQLMKEYKPYVHDTFRTSIGIFKNIDTSRLSHLPPHIDRKITLSLNYIISEVVKMY